MSSAEPHSACVLALRSDGSQIVGWTVGVAQFGLMLSALVVLALSTIAPRGGLHGLSIDTLRSRRVAALMPLYRNFWLPWPTWFELPSQVSQPTVQPFENQ